MVSLFGSSQSKETYLVGEELWFESRVITVQGLKQFKSAYKEVEMTQLHQQVPFYIGFAFVNTIG